MCICISCVLNFCSFRSGISDFKKDGYLISKKSCLTFREQKFCSFSGKWFLFDFGEKMVRDKFLQKSCVLFRIFVCFGSYGRGLCFGRLW